MGKKGKDLGCGKGNLMEEKGLTFSSLKSDLREVPNKFIRT